jgi:hypothetical protein
MYIHLFIYRVHIYIDEMNYLQRGDVHRGTCNSSKQLFTEQFVS